MIRSLLASAILAASLFLAGCLGADSSAPRSGTVQGLTGTARVLFIGDSLTYFNDLGTMLALVARSAGDTAVRSATVAFPDYALEDHFAEGSATEALRDSRWE